jgi:hypothetical protein
MCEGGEREMQINFFLPHFLSTRLGWRLLFAIRLSIHCHYRSGGAKVLRVRFVSLSVLTWLRGTLPFFFSPSFARLFFMCRLRGFDTQQAGSASADRFFFTLLCLFSSFFVVILRAFSFPPSPDSLDDSPVFRVALHKISQLVARLRNDNNFGAELSMSNERLRQRAFSFSLVTTFPFALSGST